MADPVELKWDATGLVQSVRRQEVALDILPGEHRVFRFTPASPTDVTGHVLELRFAPAPGLAAAFALTLGSGIAVPDPAAGVVVATASSAHMALLVKYRKWVCELWRMNAGNELCLALAKLAMPTPIGGPAASPAPTPFPPIVVPAGLLYSSGTALESVIVGANLTLTGSAGSRTLAASVPTGVALLNEPNTFAEPNEFLDDATFRGDIRLAGGVVQRLFATDSGAAIVFPTVVAAEAFDAPRSSHFNEALFESILGKEPPLTLRAKPYAEYAITQFEIADGALTIWLSDDAGLLQNFKQAHYSDGYADQYAVVRVAGLRPDLDGDHQVTEVLMAPGRLQVAVPGMPDEGPTAASGTASTLQNGPLVRQVDAHDSSTGEWYGTGEYYFANGNADYWYYPGGPGGSWGDGPPGFYFGFYDPIIASGVDAGDMLRLGAVGSTGISTDPELNDPDDYLVTVGAVKAFIQSLLEE